MAQKKLDGVVEAVRYTTEGQIWLVRVYERRGPTFSDRILLTRQELVDRLKAKKRFFIGRRLQFLASTFDVTFPVRLEGKAGNEMLVSGSQTSESDHLEGAPLF